MASRGDFMTNDTNEDKIYKTSATAGSGIREEIRSDLERNLSKFNDPVVIGELLYKLLEERENTNRILKNILTKLDTISSGSAAVQTVKEEIGELLLPEIDETIMNFVKQVGKATAEDVRQKFNYKGKNAASARLNRLYELQLLDKKQVGKKVFFIPKS